MGIVFMYGGGIDSVAQVILLRNQHPDEKIMLLHIDYGQVASSHEQQTAQKLLEKGYASDFYSIKARIQNQQNPLFTKLYTDKNQQYDKSKCMVEFRNAMIGVLGLFVVLNDEHFSEYRDANVCFGFYSYKNEKSFPFPDETPEFLQKLNELVSVYGYTNQFIAPFINMSKSEIWKCAYSIEPELFSIAWTCYEDGEKMCGRCPHCLYLKKFLRKELNMSDDEVQKYFIV